MKDWLENYVKLRIFESLLKEINSVEFEQELDKEIIQQLVKLNICKKSGQVASLNLKI